MTFSQEEQRFLLTILEQRHRELLMEIAHTDSREFKQGLRRDEALLDSLSARLREPVAQESHA